MNITNCVAFSTKIQTWFKLETNTEKKIPALIAGLLPARFFLQGRICML
jgi:hypothetical protein